MHALIISALLSFFAASPAVQAEELSGEMKAGYEWARDNGIEDEHSCAMEQPDFAAGCRAFVTETKAAPTDGDDAPGLDNLPPGYDFPDDEMTILE